MVLGKRIMRKGMESGYHPNTQLNTEAAAVTAVAYTSSGAINEADSVITIATNEAAYTLAQPTPGRILVITESGAAAGGITVTCTVGTLSTLGLLSPCLLSSGQEPQYSLPCFFRTLTDPQSDGRPLLSEPLRSRAPRSVCRLLL